jgi:uncharacterized Zn finger protein (UPF0148 family)
MHDGWYVCPVCEELVELMHAVTHLLEQHPLSPVSRAIRAEVDREWARAQWEEATPQT